MNFGYPYRFDARKRTAGSDENAHVRELIEQLLLTTPGERVNRPNFGSGVLQLVFAANSPELASATQLVVQGALQQWLGELIHVEDVSVSSTDAQLEIRVRFINRRTQRRELAQTTWPRS